MMLRVCSNAREQTTWQTTSDRLDSASALSSSSRHEANVIISICPVRRSCRLNGHFIPGDREFVKANACLIADSAKRTGWSLNAHCEAVTLQWFDTPRLLSLISLANVLKMPVSSHKNRVEGVYWRQNVYADWQGEQDGLGLRWYGMRIR